MDIWQKWIDKERFSGTTDEERTAAAQMIEMARRRLEGFLRLQPGQNVLEVGCGSGDWLPSLLEATAPGGRVFALDISQALLQEARATLLAGPHASEEPRVIWICQDLCEPLRIGAPLHAICGRSVLQYVTGKLDEIFGNFLNALAPDGRLAFFEASPGDDLIPIPLGINPTLRGQIQKSVSALPWRAASDDYLQPLLRSAFGQVSLEQQRFWMRRPNTASAGEKYLEGYPCPGEPSLGEIIVRGMSPRDAQSVLQAFRADHVAALGGSWCFLQAIR